MHLRSLRWFYELGATGYYTYNYYQTQGQFLESSTEGFLRLCNGDRDLAAQMAAQEVEDLEASNTYGYGHYFYQDFLSWNIGLLLE